MTSYLHAVISTEFFLSFWVPVLQIPLCCPQILSSFSGSLPGRVWVLPLCLVARESPMSGPTSFFPHLSGASVLHCLISGILEIILFYSLSVRREGESSPLTLSWVEAEILSPHCGMIGAQT